MTFPDWNKNILPAYALITPAHNEALFIKKTIESMLAQSILPIRWIIVNDGSTDETENIVKTLTAGHAWIRLINLPPRKSRDFAGKVHAFNAGLGQLEGIHYEFWAISMEIFRSALTISSLSSRNSPKIPTSGLPAQLS